MVKILRIIDANVNRTSEALRVCEDITRFALNEKTLTGSLKKTREGTLRAAKKIEHLAPGGCVKFRDTLRDVGKRPSRRELRRRDLRDVFRANAQRAKESLRSLEEVSKLLDRGISQKFKKLRFKVYEIEKKSRRRLEDLLDN